MIAVGQGKTPIEFETIYFPAGEVHVNAPIKHISNEPINILCSIESSQDLIELLMLTSAIRQQTKALINLRLPYFPGARQDRVAATGDAFGLKVYAELINSQNYNSVTVYHPHSNVLGALVNNLIAIDPPYKDIIDCIEPDTIVAPDAGAYKEVQKIAAEMDIPFIFFTKNRDPKTGKLSKFELYGKPQGKCLILDDICDGGGTFIAEADILHQNGADSCHLYVTHGIFSKGFWELFKYFDSISCLFSRKVDEDPVQTTPFTVYKR